MMPTNTTHQTPPYLGGPDLVYCDDFHQIGSIASTDADALGSVHCQPTGWMRGRMARPTSWLDNPYRGSGTHELKKSSQRGPPGPGPCLYGLPTTTFSLAAALQLRTAKFQKFD
jgi:hypothetical protein